MNIFHKITLTNLKKNKTRTIVTIIGIILSTAMFTAVTSSISSLHAFMKEYTIDTGIVTVPCIIEMGYLSMELMFVHRHVQISPADTDPIRNTP